MMGNTSKPKSKKIAICAGGLSPCNNICPAGEDIQGWLSLTKEKKFHEAWELITSKNPFPATHGRVCYHYCETRCSRIQYDESVSIHCIERFLGDMALAENWNLPVSNTNTGKKILVVGAGPAGLSAACYLRQMGHEVVIYEALPQSGGTMFAGIPDYRLPRKILFGEIDRILRTGIKIEYNHRVEDLLKEKKYGGFHAIFLGVGAHLGKNVAITMENPCKIMDAVDYLRESNFGVEHKFGSKMVIYGGGNTAIDVARVAKRLGITDITIVYHRTRDKMAAFPYEIDDAMAEGIKFTFLRTVTGIKGNTVALGINELDEKGRSKNIGQIENIETDTFIFALGQSPETDFLRKTPEIDVQPTGVVTVDNFFMTGSRGVFAGGDVTPFDRSVTIAVGHGRRAAQHINAYLNDTVFSDPPYLELIHFDRLHIDSDKSKKIVQPLLNPNLRVKSFDEVVGGSTQNEILNETQRCFSCGNCFGCGKCYATCPVKVISHAKTDGRVTGIDIDKCIGCMKCCKVCSCGAITMLDR